MRFSFEDVLAEVAARDGTQQGCRVSLDWVEPRDGTTEARVSASQEPSYAMRDYADQMAATPCRRVLEQEIDAALRRLEAAVADRRSARHELLAMRRHFAQYFHPDRFVSELERTLATRGMQQANAIIDQAMAGREPASR